MFSGDIFEESLKLHEALGGKIEIAIKSPISDARALSLQYTPGVAEPCFAIYRAPKDAYRYTLKRNTVAVVTDGSAVLGLGNIGALAAIPVMEGKAALFKAFADVDAFPICLDITAENDEDSICQIVDTVRRIAPAFGGINLEDISAPRCFEIERRLKAVLDIPVFHDDQHGTAIVACAALKNALKVVGKSIGEVTIVINGMGSAGVAITKLLIYMGARRFRLCDRYGCFYDDSADDADCVEGLVARYKGANPGVMTLGAALIGADVFIGVSVAGALSQEAASGMADGAVILAMANPVPEIMPQEAYAAGAKIVCTGRSDYKNQVNNVLAFPGVFRGALDAGAKAIGEPMKIAAVKALSALVSEEELTSGIVIPSVFNKSVAAKVAKAVAAAAERMGGGL